MQARRILDRDTDPWRRWLAPVRNRQPQPPRDIRVGVWTDLLRATDTRWAPWTVIDANDSGAGADAALTAIADLMHKSIPLNPPSEGDTVVMLNQQKAG